MILLPRHRKTEPMLLWWTKVVVSIILLSGLIVYIYVLIDLIIKDEPSIQHSTVKLDSQQLLPSFYIFMRPNLTINCEFFPMGGRDMINDALSLYWSNPFEIDHYVIEFGGELDDIKNNYSDQINLQNYIDYLQYNFVYIQANMTNVVYIKWTRRNYLIRDWTNYLGFPNHYIPLRIPEPITTTPTVAYNQTKVIILPNGFTRHEYFETVETEKRFETVLSNIGSLGGAISLLLGIYAILFGGSLLSPWGIFQNYCCKYKPRSKRKLLNNLPVIPLTQKNQLQYENSKDPDIISIITRFNSLETILREYVINSDFLDELVETKNNKIDIDESNKPLV